MRIMKIIAGLALAIGALSVGVDAFHGALAADAGVNVKDNFFEAGTTTIGEGSTVTWSFVGSATHTVTADDDAFDSGNQSSGTFVHTFNTPGTYGYYCRIHGAPGQIMYGTIIVQANTPTATNTSGTQSTATRTPTRTVTSTPAADTTAVPTQPAATNTPIAAIDSLPPPTRTGGAGQSITAPRTGSGGSSPGSSGVSVMSVAMAIIGGAMAASAAIVRASARRHGAKPLDHNDNGLTIGGRE